MTLRQIPLETVFNSNDANSWRDPIIKNRIHFRFPDTWTNNVNKDAIIGIRDMFITKGYRKLELQFGYTIRRTIKTYFGTGDIRPDKPVNTATEFITQDLIPITKFFSDETFFKNVYEKFKEVIDDYNEPITENNTTYNNVLCKYLKNVSGFDNDQKELIDQNAYFESEYGFNNNHESYFKIHCPYNDLDEDDRAIESSLSGQTYEGFIGTGTIWERDIYDIYIVVAGMNDDAKNILNVSEVSVMEPELLFRNIWDRDSCILYSSLAYMSNNSYLGHTRRYALPKIKYYELTSSNKSFWVDLFATRDHNAPVILPADNKDELYIEAQLLTSQQAVF